MTLQHKPGQAGGTWDIPRLMTWFTLCTDCYCASEAIWAPEGSQPKL